MRFDSSSIINLPRTPQGAAQPKAWSFTTCPRKTQVSLSQQNWRTRVGLTFPRACQVAMTRITNQGSLVWNAHIPNWGATSSSENMAIWVITEAGKQIKQSVNIFDCSWLHPNLFLDRFSEVHTCPTLSARDKWLQILLHADLGPKNRGPLCKSTSSSFPKQFDQKLRYTMVCSTSHTSPWYLPPPSAHRQSRRPLLFQQSPGMLFDYALPGICHVSHEVSTQVINELPNRHYNFSNLQIDRQVIHRFFSWSLRFFLFGVAATEWLTNSIVCWKFCMRKQCNWPSATTTHNHNTKTMTNTHNATTKNQQQANKHHRHHHHHPPSTRSTSAPTSTSTSTPISATTARRRRRSRRVQRTGAKGRYNHEGTNAGNNCPSRQKEHRPKAPIFPSMFSEIHLYYCIPRITTAEGNEQKYRHIILRNIPTYLDSNRYRHI